MEMTAIDEAGLREFEKLKLENEDLKQRIVDLTALLIKHLADPGDHAQLSNRMRRH